MPRIKTNKADPTKTQKERFRQLTGKNPVAANVKEHFKEAKNLAFYNRLTEKHHGSSLEFWTIATARIEASIKIHDAGHKINELSSKNLQLMNSLLNLGFAIDETRNNGDCFKNFPPLWYTSKGQKVQINFNEESDRGIILGFLNGTDNGLNEYFSTNKDLIMAVYRFSKFLVEYVIPLKAKATLLEEQIIMSRGQM